MQRLFNFKPAIVFLSFLPLVYGGSFLKIDYNNKIINDKETYLNHVATQVTVFCDGKKQIVNTRAQYLEEAISEAGINLYEYDIVSPNKNLLLGGTAVSAVIERSRSGDFTKRNINKFSKDNKQLNIVDDIEEFEGISINFSADEENIKTKTIKKTVGEFLDEMGVYLIGKDRVEPGVGAIISNNMNIKVTRVREKYIDVTTQIPYEIIYQDNPSLSIYDKIPLCEGQNGEKIGKTKIVYENGQKMSESVISSKIKKQAINQVVETGSQSGRANFGYYAGLATAFKGRRGQQLLVTNLNNGKSVVVTVVDYGPVNSLLDLGVEAYRFIGGSTRDGRIPNVSVRLLN